MHQTIDPPGGIPAAGPVAPAAPADTAARCENCAEPLLGTYCHACGQSVHNPLRHAGHALQEVFESFWHLDGRIFRTLRDLLVPGRVANAYIAGHRARYIAPLRLFVVLSLLTFFIAQYSVELDADSAIRIDSQGMNIGPEATAGTDAGDFARATSVAEVEALRDGELVDIDRARALIGARVPGGATALDAAATAVRTRAQARIEELRRDGAPVGAAHADDAAASPPAAPAPTAAGAPAEPEREFAWDASANPIHVAWLPPAANAWLNQQSERASRNAMAVRRDPQRYMRAVLGTVPTTLFMMVPVFALLLKALYLFKRRLYLEHLVIALYSHVFLLMALLGVFLAMWLRHATAAQWPWLGTLAGWAEGLLWFGMPVYLLLMQKRVYRQGWPMTLLKYAVLGLVYVGLLGVGTLATFFYSLLRF